MDTIKIPFYEDYTLVEVDDWDSYQQTLTCNNDNCYCSEKYIQAWTMKLMFFFILFFMI
jgi:hypothetical protein